jgi:hypothetical protein
MNNRFESWAMAITTRFRNGILCSLLAMTLALSACSNEKLPKYTVLQGLRVLTLVSDAPEVSFDGSAFLPASINITPVISDLYGAGRVLKYNLQVCLDLGIALGVAPNCENNPTKSEVVNSGTVTSTGGSTFVSPNYSGTVNADAIGLSGGGADIGASALAVVTAKFTAAAAYQQFNGQSLIVYYEVYPDGDESQKVKAFKRIVFSSAAKAVKNTNPTTLSIVDENGSAVSSLPSVETKLKTTVGAADAESYTVMDDENNTSTKTESIETTWFLTGPESLTDSKDKDLTTDGLFLFSRTFVGELNTFFAPTVDVPTARGRVFIGIARDDRGGSVITRFCTGAGALCP